MTVFQAYISGLQTTFRNWRMWLLLYALNFLFALLLVYPLSGFLTEKLSTTLAIDKLATGFDYSIFNDILNEYGDTIGAFYNLSTFAALFYLLFSVFVVGGILNVFLHHKTSTNLANFWSGAGNYFWRILRLTFYFIIIHSLVAFIFMQIYGFFTAGGFDNYDSEKYLWQVAYVILPIYLFVATIFFMIQDYAKIHIVHSDEKWITQPILQAFRFVFKNLGKTLLLYFLNLLTFLVVFFIYWKINGPLGPNSILLAFIIGQAFILFRIASKLWNLGSAVAWFELKKSPTTFTVRDKNNV